MVRVVQCDQRKNEYKSIIVIDLHIFSDIIQASSDSRQWAGTYMLVVKVTFVGVQWLRCMSVRDLRNIGM